jgi:1-acyl-sn-glycerol-3-phosphate acyltransferase
LWYLARRTAFHGLLGWYLPTVNTIPVNQEGVATDGLRRSLDVLRRSEPILIFPEGQRSWDGVMRPFQPGILLLIRKAAPPIVPVGIAGSFEALPRARRYPIPTLSPLFLPPGRSTLAVSIGRPFDSTRFLDRPREEVLNELFVEVKKMQLQAERLRRR